MQALDAVDGASIRGASRTDSAGRDAARELPSDAIVHAEKAHHEERERN